ncbi:MAG: alkaline phosphatase family protein, partial [Longimicrobiales bacterium]|nr:alkaline phosphatase family protein [Longimicrobiales bacterium]
MRREIAHLVLVPIVLLAWARLGAPQLTLYSWDAVAGYRSPYTSAIAPGQDGDAVSRRVVVVVVDALRADASRTLPTINRLRETGAERTARTGQPSLSYPSWTVIGTGAWQEQSGVTTNFYKRDIPVDTIFEAAK